ncbi:MAG TPA: hypothetical protein VGO57_09310 [Verrucomicrobiae bacterium]|jgi:hypothetical protein
MKYFIFILLSVANFSLFAVEFSPFDGPKPIAVLIQPDPWAMIMGANNPRVAVYEDGTVIFLKESEKTASYRQKKLSAPELVDFKKRLMPTTNLKDLKHFYSLIPNLTDQPKAQFYFRDGERTLVTSIYGLRADGTKSSTLTNLSGAQAPEAGPGELLALHKFLCSLDYPDSQEWTPCYLEVMIWPYTYAPDASIIWPRDWPGLESEHSFKRGDSYSIFLDGNLRPELQKFLKSQKERGAVEIDGKKWALSWRAVFPSEPIWRKGQESAQYY